MGFVQASLLAALAAVVLPVLAHLVFRRRSRPVDLGTLRFLKIAVRRGPDRLRLHVEPGHLHARPGRGLREDLRVLADTLGVVLPSLPHPRLRRSAAL